MFKIFALNIRAGGGDKTRLPRLLNHMPDVDAVVLSEYRDNKNGQLIREYLAEPGRDYRSFAFLSGSLANGVLVGAKKEARIVEVGQRVCALDIDGLLLCGVYMALEEAKRPFYEHLLRDYSNTGCDTVIVGDFNTGRVDLDISSSGKTHACLDCFAELESRMTEAWRYLHPTKREYSWSSKGHKTNIETHWRIDHAFLSNPLIPRLSACEYDHTFRQNNNSLSDHSGLLLKISDFQVSKE